MTHHTGTIARDTVRLDANAGVMPFDAISRETVSPPSDGYLVSATLSCPQPDTTVCTVTGRVDLITAPILIDTLTEAVHDDHSHLVIDLSAVTVLDPAALRTILEALDSYHIDGHVAVVVNSGDEAITAPEMSALAELLDMHDDLAGALQACARALISAGGRHRARVMNRPRALWGVSIG